MSDDGSDGEFAGIRSDIRAYAGKVDKYHEAVAVIGVELQECRRKVDEHELSLDGPPSNGGRPGIKTRLANLEDRAKLRMRVIFIMVGFMSAVASGLIVAYGRVVFAAVNGQ